MNIIHKSIIYIIHICNLYMIWLFSFISKDNAKNEMVQRR